MISTPKMIFTHWNSLCNLETAFSTRIAHSGLASLKLHLDMQHSSWLIYLSVCLSLLSVCQSVSLSCLSISLSVCVSVPTNQRTYLSIYPSLSEWVILSKLVTLQGWDRWSCKTDPRQRLVISTPDTTHQRGNAILRENCNPSQCQLTKKNINEVFH